MSVALSASVAWSALKGDTPSDGAPAAAPAPRDTTMRQAVQETAMAGAYVEAVAYARWLDHAYWSDIEAWSEAYERAQQYRASVRPSPVLGGAVGECTGFPIPDYIIQRESGGDPNAHNASSGAHGCSQTLLSHYGEDRSCEGLDPNTVDGQRECTRVLSNDGTNLDPWAETR